MNIRGGKAIYVEEAICVDVHTMTPCTLILTLACINEHACSERARHGAACKCARHTWMYISMGRKTHGYIYIYRGRNTWIYTSIERETHGTPASGQELHLVITSSHTAEEPYFSTKEPFIFCEGLFWCPKRLYSVKGSSCAENRALLRQYSTLLCAIL